MCGIRFRLHHPELSLSDQTVPGYPGLPDAIGFQLIYLFEAYYDETQDMCTKVTDSSIAAVFRTGAPEVRDHSTIRPTSTSPCVHYSCSFAFAVHIPHARINSAGP